MVVDKAKKFQIIGEIKKPLTTIPFTKTIDALTQSDAIEQLLSEMGSKHKAKRYEFKILQIEELKEEN